MGHDDKRSWASLSFWEKIKLVELLLVIPFAAGEITEEEIKQMESEITAIIDDAVEWADKSPYPDPEDCLKGVYYDEHGNP